MFKRILTTLVLFVFLGTAAIAASYGKIYLYNMYPMGVNVTVNGGPATMVSGFSSMTTSLQQHIIGTTKLLQEVSPANTVHVTYTTMGSPSINKATKTLANFQLNQSIYIVINHEGDIDISQ